MDNLLTAFELYLEELNNSIDDLPRDRNTVSTRRNLKYYADRLYTIFENIRTNSDAAAENEILKAILSAMLDDDNKLYYRIKYGISL